MNILIAFECSGALRLLFRAAGHNCWSVDLKQAEGCSNYHIQDDVFNVLNNPPAYCEGATFWDLVVLHPECKALTVAGNHVYAEGKPKHQERLDAIVFVETLVAVATFRSRRVAVENPIGVLSTQSTLGKAAQYLQPYQFGDDASKSTGLWLYDLPKIVANPADRVPGRIVMINGKSVERWSNQTDSGQNILGPSPERSADRARTYPGIARAMVEQWGSLQA